MKRSILIFFSQNFNLGQVIQTAICHKILNWNVDGKSVDFSAKGDRCTWNVKLVSSISSEMNWSQKQRKGELTTCSSQEGK